MPLDAFLLGPGKTALETDELLIGIECEALPGYGASFEKVGHRRSLVISLVCLAALVKLDRSGRTFEDVRLAIGGIGPVPQRLMDVESFLRAGPITARRLDEAAGMPLALVASRTRQEYRRDVVRGFVARALIDAVRAAGGDPGHIAPELEAAHA
jgi:carbon-monoxide dehydrogenase medium subunit/xanthine dehydrogenase FAD-binding subunit